MAFLHAWSFVFLTGAIAISVYPVAATDAKVDKKGYEVTTVLDCNKLKHSFYSVYEDATGGASLIALDFTRSSILRVSSPLSQSSRIERISGSPEGKPGYRDGSTNEALFDHPRKLTLDRDGTIYVADTKNAAVRMITRSGLVTTIAGGSNRTGHKDGEGSEVLFSNDFDVTYVSSTCTIAIVDRGNHVVRELQLPQFIGRCSGATPNPPESIFTSATLLMLVLAGIMGIAAGVAGTILNISTERLESLQSGFCWAKTEGISASIRKKTRNSSSTQQVKETMKTRSSVIRNAAVENLVWSPALIMEMIITLFEKLLYIILYSMSLLLRLLCLQPFRKLFHKAGTKNVHNPNSETDLLGLHEQASYQPSVSRNFSMSLMPAFGWVGSMGTLFVQWSFFQMKNFQQASPHSQDSLVLEDLIDFSETTGVEVPVQSQSEDSARASGTWQESTPEDVDNELNMDSMVKKCLAELTALSPQHS